MRKAPPVEHSNANSRSYIILGIIFTLGAVAVWLYLNRSNIQEYTTVYQSREQSKENIQETKQRISQLKRQQQSLSANGVETEKRIRERLKMHKPGEKVVFFVKESATSTSIKTSSTKPSSTPEQNNSK